MNRLHVCAGLTIAALILAVRVSAQDGPDVMKIKPFALTRVRLIEGRWNDEMQRDRAYLHALDTDRLLYAFRTQAGLPAPGEAYGGWEAMTCDVRGHFPGHFLTACALMYAATGDTALKAKADSMVAELAKCQQAMGGRYLSAFPESFWDRLETEYRGWAPYYVVHKMMAGLYDMYTLCGNQQALEVLIGMADYFQARLDKLPDETMDRILRVEFGGMSESLHDLYTVTRDPRHLELAHRFDQAEFLGPLALDHDNLTHIHGNTQIPKVVAAARRYEITGDTRYRHIAEFFWDRVVNARTYATGGSTMFETWPQPNRLADTLGHLNHETCKTYNMLRLTRHLLCWTSDAAYGDFYERALFNGILGTQGPKPGELQYYVAMASGYPRVFGTPDNSFWCCYGTGIESFAKLGDSIYFHAPGQLYVNLFIPSTLDWAEEEVRIEQRTDFPREDTIRLRLSMKAEKTFGINIRIPYWVAQAPPIRVNGEPFAAPAAEPGSWLTIERAWRDGDTVEARLPMALHTKPLPDAPETVAVLYGPLVLAGIVDERPGEEAVVEPVHESIAAHPMSLPPLYIEGDPGAPAAWIVPVAGEPLTFTAPGQPLVKRFVPFSDIVKERYALYFPVAAKDSPRGQEYKRAAERWAREIDRVFIYPNDTNPGMSERRHALKSEKASAGAIPGTARVYRHATAGGWFEWTMKVVPDAPVSLLCTYWGSDTGRTFDILVDGALLKTEQLDNLNPGGLADVEYAVPREMTQGKQSVTLRFFANHDTMAGGVFGCATLRASGTP